VGRPGKDRLTGSPATSTSTPSEPLTTSPRSAAPCPLHPRRPHRLAPPPQGQTLYVTDGIGLVSYRGGETVEIRPGALVYIEPGEEHWHGATSDWFMAHVAMQEVDDHGQVVTWLEHVTDQEYASTT
jgi:hypothetical protein